MAKIDHNGLKRNITHQGTWGNLCAESRTINSDPDDADVLRFMKLPQGTTIMDHMLVHDAFGTGVTAELGIEPVSGATPTPAALMADASIAAAGVKRGLLAPITLTEDCYITMTTDSANADGLHDAVLTVSYVFNGE